MEIGGEYMLPQVGLRQWQKLAAEIRLNADEMIERLRRMAAQLPDEISDARKRPAEEGLHQAIMDRLATRLTERAVECQQLLTAAAWSSSCDGAE